MGRLFERAIISLVVLFIILYSGYQAYRFFSSPIHTETVFQYTQSNSVQARGIAIRDELVLDQRVSGVESYSFEDGTRVAVGQTVAEFYTSSVGDQSIRRARELEQEIAMLKLAQDKSVNNYANVDVLNRSIRESLVNLTGQASLGRYRSVQDIRPDMSSLLNRKQIAIGRVQNFDKRIAQLEAEYNQLEPQTRINSVMTVTAPEPGYFSKLVDGYEHILSYSELANYTFEQYMSLLSGSLQPESATGIGRLVRSQSWAFVFKLPGYKAGWLRMGQNVSLNFDSVSQPVPATVEDIIQERDQDEKIVILKSDYLSGELINLRMENATISHQKFTGLRINTSDIRFSGWVFEATLPKKDVQWMEAGRRVTIHFDSSSTVPVTARLTQVVQEENSEQASIVLICDTLPSQEVTLQPANVKIVDNELSENSLSSQTKLLYKGEVRGVYVLEGNEVRFKAIDPVYEEGDFVLSKLNYFDSIDKQHVRLYDQVITRGNDIYDGKIVR